MKTFILRASTKDNKAVIAAGLYKTGFCPEVVKKTIEQTAFGNTHDPFLIDYKVMKMLNTSCTNKSIFVIGASIRISGIGTNCGGVIGVPGEYEALANGTQSVKIGEAYSLIVRPGKLGTVCKIEDEKKITTILDENRTLDSSTLYWLIRRNGLMPCLFVSDGCGPNACGFVAACGHEIDAVYYFDTGQRNILSTRG